MSYARATFASWQILFPNGGSRLCSEVDDDGASRPYSGAIAGVAVALSLSLAATRAHKLS